MSGDQQIIPVCAPQRMDAEIPADAQIGGISRDGRGAVTVGNEAPVWQGR